MRRERVVIQLVRDDYFRNKQGPVEAAVVLNRFIITYLLSWFLGVEKDLNTLYVSSAKELSVVLY
jgi:hypothetical protein